MTSLPSNYEESSVGFRLLDEECCLVEPVRPSGFTDAGLYVIDQEGHFASKTSMMVRVVGCARKCDLKLGAVYIVPVYAWETFPYKGETFCIMHQANARAEVEGYDDAL